MRLDRTKSGAILSSAISSSIEDLDDSITVVERKPPKEFLREMNQHRKVLTKDIEETDWEDTRDVSKMSTLERSLNIKKAQLERSSSKIQKQPQIKKKGSNDKGGHGYEIDDDSHFPSRSRIPDFVDSPESISKLDQIKIDRANQKKAERHQRSAKRKLDQTGFRDEKTKTKSDVDDNDDDDLMNEVDSQDDDTSDTASVNQDDLEDIQIDAWRDSNRDLSALKSKAKRLLRHCESVGRDLRSRLSSWGGQAADAADESKAYCTGLLSIDSATLDENNDTGSNSEVLREDYFNRICPGLVLKGYQLVGVNWLKLLHENKINGILADDMGLGKTVQSIAFLGWLKTKQTHTARGKVHLIVVPASTLSNWENELKRFCPSLVVVTYHGSQDERADIRYDLRGSFESGKLDVLLSTFTIFERESGKDDRSFLYRQKFEYLIIDEAHCLKVSTSSRFANLNEIKSAHRLLLSGTPVQNDLSELLALMSFIMPDIFRKIGIDEILEGFGWDKKSSGPSASSSAVSINQLRAMLAPFVLRRVKSDVLDQLVDKVSFLEKVQMTEFQTEVYDNILNGHIRRKEKMKLKAALAVAEDVLVNGSNKAKKGKGKVKVKENSGTSVSEVPLIDGTLAESADFTVHTQGEGPKGESDPEKIVRELSNSEAAHLFTALRKAANHPLLLRVRYQDEETMSKIAEIAYSRGRFGNQCDYQRVRDEIDGFSDFDLHQLCLEYPETLGHLQLGADVLYDSQKMQKLKIMLPKLVAEGHRILVFSQWTRLLDLLEVLLNDIELYFLRLDGSTPVKERQELIDSFSREDSCIPIFLLSTKAGGLGINLTAADTVIMHDLDFNPENDRQAEDRCHRIGQTKAVRVFRLVTADTVDEDIYRMGERKRKLTAAVLSDHHTAKERGLGQGDQTDADHEDIGAIGRILQRALLKNREKQLLGVSAAVVGSSAPHAVDFDGAAEKI